MGPRGEPGEKGDTGKDGAVRKPKHWNFEVMRDAQGFITHITANPVGVSSGLKG